MALTNWIGVRRLSVACLLSILFATPLSLSAQGASVAAPGTGAGQVAHGSAGLHVAPQPRRNPATHSARQALAPRLSIGSWQAEPTAGHRAAAPITATFTGTSQGADVAAYPAGNPSDQAVSPPDDNIAVSTSQIAEIVNSSLWIGSTNTGLSGQSLDLTTLWSVPGTLPSGWIPADPRIVFDTLVSRWYVSGMVFNDNAGAVGQGSIAFLAVSTTSTISIAPSAWRVFQVTPSQSTLLFDQPKLGYSSDKIVLSWNDFSGGFVGSELWVLNKTDALAASGSLHECSDSSAPDMQRFSITPAQLLTYSTTDTAAWAVYNNSDPPLVGNVPALGVIKMAGVPTSTTATSPCASNGVIMTESQVPIAPTSIPNGAAQFGTATLVDTGDDRLLNATWMNGTLWTTANDACGSNSCGRFIEVAASATTGVQSIAGQDFDVSQPGGDAYYAAASFDTNGDLMASINTSTPQTHPNVVVVGQAAGAPGSLTFSTVLVQSNFPITAPSSNPGCGPISNQLCARWGDYGGAALDPSDASGVWVVGQYMLQDQTGAIVGGNWGTSIAHLDMPSGTVIRLAARGGDGAAWSLSGSDANYPEFNGAWSSLGGLVIGAPAVVSVPIGSGPETPYYIATGTDHQVYVRGDSIGWQHLTAYPVSCAGPPGVTALQSMSGANIVVACRGGDGGLWYATAPAPASATVNPHIVGAWTSLGGQMVDAPAIAALPPFTTNNNQPTFFVNGINGGPVWSRTATTGWTATSWSCTGHLALAAITTPPLAAFACQGLDHAVWTATNTGGGWTTHYQGGRDIDGPGIAMTTSRWTVVVEGVDHQLYQSTGYLTGFPPTGSWFPTGGVLTNGATAAALVSPAASP